MRCELGMPPSPNGSLKTLRRIGVEFLVVLGGLGALVRIRGIVNDRLVLVKEQLFSFYFSLFNKLHSRLSSPTRSLSRSAIRVNSIALA